ncbi:MAG: TonB-dependent receptor [Cyanobacteria bacterium J06560_5]
MSKSNMMNRWRGALLTVILGAVALAMGQPAVAAEVEKRAEEDASAALIEVHQSGAARLAEAEPEAISVDEWLTRIAQADPIEITNIEIEETEQGFTLRLVASGELTISETSVAGNAAITDISNATLNLPEGEDFLVSSPAEGIALVSASELPDNRVRIAITGADAPPAVDFRANALGLTASVGLGEALSQSSDDEAIQLTVTGEQADDNYFEPDASTATRTDTPLRDIPNAIQVIPRQVIEDQQATGLEDALENAAGVGFDGDDGGRSLTFNIRGFDEAPVLRDGFITPGFRTDPVAPEVSNLESVEVLRGPASVLYGQVEPGGVVNLVSKRPLSEPYYNLQLQGGSREFINPSIDLSGPLTGEGDLLYRLNALYRTEDSFRDFENDFERFFVAPTLTWLISEQTELTASLEYTEDYEPLDIGTVALGEGFADIPRERVLNDPDSTVSRDSLSARYALEHRFSNNWQLRNQFRYSSSAYDWNVTAFPVALDEATGLLNRLFASDDADVETYALNTSVQGEFSTGSLDHTLLFGVDLLRAENRRTLRLGAPTPINIFEPDNLDVETPPLDSLAVRSDNTTTINQLGLYLQDQIDILDNLILVAGLRYDTVNQEVENNLNDTETEQNDDVLIPRIGIVYQPIEPVSLYANYSRSFVPNSGLDVDSQPLPPETGDGFEVGIRGEIVENRLLANLAYFHITKQNVATADPDALFGSVATGEQRSQGIDFSLTGEILPGWNVVASYAYIDAEVTSDNTDIVGNRLSNIPEHSASLWTTYEVQSGDLQGLGVGLGANFVGKRQGDLNNSFEADSYFLTNASVFYRQNDWRAQLNFENLFDVEYISSTGNRVRFNEQGDPFTVRASVSYTF